MGPSRRPRSSQVNSANPDHEKRHRADFVVDTSRGFDAARAELRAILDGGCYNAEAAAVIRQG